MDDWDHRSETSQQGTKEFSLWTFSQPYFNKVQKHDTKGGNHIHAFTPNLSWHEHSIFRSSLHIYVLSHCLSFIPLWVIVRILVKTYDAKLGNESCCFFLGLLSRPLCHGLRTGVHSWIHSQGTIKVIPHWIYRTFFSLRKYFMEWRSFWDAVICFISLCPALSTKLAYAVLQRPFYLSFSGTFLRWH